MKSSRGWFRGTLVVAPAIAAACSSSGGGSGAQGPGRPDAADAGPSADAQVADVAPEAGEGDARRLDAGAMCSLDGGRLAPPVSVCGGTDAGAGRGVAFDSSVSFPAAMPDALELVVGDFNGDGHADLVARGFGGVSQGQVANSPLTMMLGRGDGTFGAPQKVFDGPPTYAMSVGDVNGDGMLDLVAVAMTAQAPDSCLRSHCTSSSLIALIGAGDGTFSSVETSPNPLGCGAFWTLVADFNGDGQGDVAVGGNQLACHTFGGGAAVALSSGGALAASTTLTFGPGSGVMTVAAGDFDGDGIQDLAVASYAGLEVRRGRGDGTFDDGDVVTPDACVTLRAADVNGDGVQDLLASSMTGPIDVFLGGCGRPLGKPIVIPDGQYVMAVADFDGDGLVDILGETNAALSIFSGHGDGSFDAARPLPARLVGGSIGVADFDHDGLADLAIVPEFGSNAVAVSLNASCSGVPRTSACTPDGCVETVATVAGSLAAIDADYAYVMSSDAQAKSRSLVAVPLAGGAARTITSALRYSTGALAIDATNAYIVDDVGEQILEVPLAGGAVATIASATYPQSIAVDDANVYWTTGVFGAASVMRAPTGGGAPATLAGGREEVNGLAVDATNAYFGDDTGLWRVAKSGGAPEQIFSGGRVSSIVLDATHAYVTCVANRATRDSVWAVPLAGGKPTHLADGDVGPLVGANVYWGQGRTRAEHGGYIGRTPIGGGVASTLVYGLDVYGSPLFASGGDIFWTSDHGTLEKLTPR